MSDQQLSEEKLNRLKDELSKLLAMDRYTVVSRYPFIGGILMHLKLIPVRDCRCPTACTDGKNVYCDIAFYSGLSEAERVFVLAHETWHCVMLHTLRHQGRIPMLWNIATDMEVNNIISTSAQDYIFQPPKDTLLPPRELKDHSAEEIYEWLLKQQQKPNQNQSKNGGGSSNNNDQKDRSGNSSSKLKGQFDKHKLSGQPEENQNNQSEDGGTGVTDKYGEVGFDKDFTPSAQNSYADDIRDAVIAEAQKCERNQGTLPASIKALIEKYRKPEIRWQDELAKFVTPIFGGKRQWLPPNRRHIYNEMYFQSRRNESINVCVVIDTSGSCLGDLPKFFTELCGLVSSFGHYSMMVIQCDCQVDDVQEYASDGEQFDPDTKFEASGGGGTSFVPPFEYLKEHGIRPECLIYFTDGYGDAPQQAPNFPVLWIVTSDGSRDFCNWGKKIRFKHDEHSKYK